MSLTPGTRLGAYEVIDRLGAGGMGEVYRARDTRLDRTVALKVLSGAATLSGHQRERFEREARAVARLSHPNICTVHDVGEASGVGYLVMEYVVGETLAAKIAASGPRGGLAPVEAAEYATQVAQALAAAHGEGVIHRDIKPSNIVITPAGKAKVLDFGLAKLVEAAAPEATTVADPRFLTAAGTVMGTPNYMSPEQALGRDVDARSDLFSLGVVLYEMLAGRLPFGGGTSQEVADAILHEAPAPLGSATRRVPAALERVVRRLLEKDRTKRYQEAGALADDLEKVRGLLAGPARRGRRALRLVAWGGIGAAVVAAVVALVRPDRQPVVNATTPVLLAEFANTTGDPVFDGTLRQALAVKLNESPHLNLLPESRVREILARMQRPPDEPMTGALAREICERQGIPAILTGRISALGTRYVLFVTAEQCGTGAALAAAQEEAAAKEQVLEMLGRAAATLRRKLGESLQSIQARNVPLEDATTTSLEALKAFSVGVDLQWTGRLTEAIPQFERAIELDPSFALAHQRLGVMHLNLGRRAQGRQSLERAFELRARTSERERLHIEGLRSLAVTGDLRRTVATYELFRQLYPVDALPANNLSVIHRQLGDFEHAVEMGFEAIRLAPERYAGYGNIAVSQMALGRLAEAKATCQLAFERGFDFGELHHLLYQIAHIEQDRAALDREAAWLNQRQADHRGLLLQADAAVSAGRWREGSGLLTQAVAAARDRGDEEPAARYLALEAWLAAELGLARHARSRAAAAVDRVRERDVLIPAGLALARVGEIGAAGAVIDQLEERFPLDTIAQNVGVRAIRAAVQLSGRDPAAAVRTLASTDPLEFGGDTAPFAVPYLRGQAHLQAGDLDGASAQFRRILDRRSVRPVSPLIGLSHLGLARARAALGDAAGAREHYDLFLAAWKEADADLPILKAARTEAAALK